jgi:hypothetical protein
VKSCRTDETLLQNDSNIHTVSREQAIQFLQQNPLKGSGNKINVIAYEAIRKDFKGDSVIQNGTKIICNEQTN